MYIGLMYFCLRDINLMYFWQCIFTQGIISPLHIQKIANDLEVIWFKVFCDNVIFPKGIITAGKCLEVLRQKVFLPKFHWDAHYLTLFLKIYSISVPFLADGNKKDVASVILGLFSSGGVTGRHSENRRWLISRGSVPYALAALDFVDFSLKIKNTMINKNIARKTKKNTSRV